MGERGDIFKAFSFINFNATQNHNEQRNSNNESVRKENQETNFR